MFFAVLLFALIAVLPAEAAGSKAAAPLKIVAFGDSLTSGHRLPQKDAYPAVIQQKLNAAGGSIYVHVSGAAFIYGTVTDNRTQDSSMRMAQMQ